jgi:phage baseplate assembly protein W
MAILYPDIKTKNWQLSTVGIGMIAEGLEDIRQCLEILLRTQKGTDPLRPQFGCDISQFIDRPITIAIPNIIRAMIEAIEIWETRVTIKKIRYEIEVSRVRFFITCGLVDGELIDLILLYQNGGFAVPGAGTSSLTLYALFPPNPSSKRYTISFIGNGNVIAPLPPPGGFASPLDLFGWVQSNWGAYGTWQMASDRITLFVPNGVLTSGSLTVSLVGSLRFEAPVPLLAIGQDYGLTFIPDGVPAEPDPPSSFVSLGDLLAWVQSNWAVYGIWTVESNTGSPGDFDPADFDSEDFDTGISTHVLVLDSETVNTCTLNVSIA